MFLDSNGNGRQNNGEQPLGGVTVQLLDASGAIVATTRTLRDGSYTFDNLELGKYTVQISVPSTSSQQVVPSPHKVQITAGGDTTVDFAIKTGNNQGGPTRPGLSNGLTALLNALGAWLEQVLHASQPNSAPDAGPGNPRN